MGEGTTMLSSSLSIAEFFEKAKGHSYQEIIQMADKEATEVERFYYKSCREEECLKIVQYVEYLKDFILYMRHGIRTRITRDLNLRPFKQIRLDH